MHSPIIYLIQNDSEIARELRGNLPDHHHLYDEDVFDLIPECDWLVANTLKEKGWHRNQWNHEFIDMFEDDKYLDLVVHDDNLLELSINKSSVLNWDKRALQLNQKYTDSLKKYHDSETPAPHNPFDDISDYFEHKDLVGTSYGGERFALFSTSLEEDLTFNGIYTIKELMDYAKSELDYQNTENITFQLCQNIVGDYHY